MAVARNRRSGDPAGVREAMRFTLIVLAAGLGYFVVLFLVAR